MQPGLQLGKTSLASGGVYPHDHISDLEFSHGPWALGGVEVGPLGKAVVSPPRFGDQTNFLPLGTASEPYLLAHGVSREVEGSGLSEAVEHQNDGKSIGG